MPGARPFAPTSTAAPAVVALAAALFGLACSRRPADGAPPPSAGGSDAAAPVASVAPSPPVGSDGAAGSPPPPPSARGPYNVVLVSVDSLRADMPWAGYPRPIAPRLSALEAKAVTFSRAYATSSFTSKSVGTFVSGRYPSELERTGKFFTKYLAKNRMLCEALDEAGVGCWAAHAHAYFGEGQSGFEQGFRSWKLVPNIPFDYQKDPYVTSHALTPLAIAQLEAASKASGERPFFAWFHYMDPHDVYQGHAEAPHFGKRPRDLYDEEVFYTDLWIGKLVDWIEAQPFAARTVLVVTADHGEAFGEHGMNRHAHEIWEELVHVPLFFVVPGAPRRVVDVARGHVDLAPTFRGLLGVAPDPSLPGVSLVPELFGAPAAERDVIVDLPEDEYNERRRALVRGTRKLVAFGKDARFQLYDLAADPGERDDLAKKDPELLREMREAYRAASARVVDVAPTGGVPKH